MVTTISAQVASSLTSLLVSVGVARVSTVDEFGGFGLLFGTALLIATLVRSFLVEPVIVTANQERTYDAAVLRRRHASVVGAGLLLPVPFAFLLALALAQTSAGLSTAALWLAIPTTVLVVAQDALRFYAIGTGRAFAAVRSDVTWLVIQAAATLAAFLGWLDTAGSIAAWGAGAGIGVVVGCVLLNVTPTALQGVRDSLARWRLGLSWMVDAGIVNAIGQAIPWVLASATGTSAVAAYRGALVLLGPSTVALVGMRSLVLRDLSRTAPARIPPRTLKLSALYGAVSLVLPAPLLLIPDSWGELLLGDSWAVGRAVLPYAMAWRVAASLSTPSLLALRAQSETRSVLALRVLASVLTLAAGFAGAAADGAQGAFTWLAASALVMVPLWLGTVWLVARREQGSVDESERSSRTASSSAP